MKMCHQFEGDASPSVMAGMTGVEMEEAGTSSRGRTDRQERKGRYNIDPVNRERFSCCFFVCF